MSTISGIRRLNERLTITGFTQTVNFTNAQGTEFTGMSMNDIGRFLAFQYKGNVAYNHIYNDTSSWLNKDVRLRVLDFGDIPQEVSEKFYTWLIANSVEENLDILQALRETVKGVKDYSDKKDDELKQEIETWHNYGMIYAGETAEVNEFYYGEVEA